MQQTENTDRKTGAKPPLDPGFRPLSKFIAGYRLRIRNSPARERLLVALEREEGRVFRADIDLLPASEDTAQPTWTRVERHIKFLLWSRGGWHLTLHGPVALCRRIQQEYADVGTRSFDALMMERAYGRAFKVRIAENPDDVPPARETPSSLGGHLNGCRIGFDLGASDYKLAAVVDGKPVFTKEIPWQPSKQSDPAYHAGHIRNAIREAAAHLPRVDAIGGSAAGIYVNNEVRIASLFRSVPRHVFDRVVRPMFINLEKEWQVPLVVINDGDVTALAGSMSLGRNSLLGVAMGSSEAAGYLDAKGKIHGYLNELAFCPVDVNPDATTDEWSGDRGVGAQYFSQQAVARLAAAAGFAFPENMPLPERLLRVQSAAEAMDPDALRVFDTIGVYLGHAVFQYHAEYGFSELLLLGRVTSGAGGTRIIERARATLDRLFPDLAGKVTIHVPDETSRRHGQAVAAASLPELPQ